MLAYSMRASSAAAFGTSSASSLPAAGAGTATITASASIVSGSLVGPVTRRQPVRVRLSSRTMTPVLMSAPDAAATAPGRLPMPAFSVVNTGPASLGASPLIDRAAFSSERSVRAIVATRGMVASRDRNSARPA